MILRFIATLQDWYCRFRDRKERCPVCNRRLAR